MTDVPLGAPRKREQKGGRLKNLKGGSDKANRPSRTVLPDLYSFKGHSAHCQALKQYPGRVQRTKYDSMIKRSVTIPKIFPPYDILKLSSSYNRYPLLPSVLQLIVNQPLLNPQSSCDLTCLVGKLVSL